MKLTLLLFLTVAVFSALSNNEGCSETAQEDCESTTSDYENYKECMQRRTKRSAGCYRSSDSDCENCDCDTCTYTTCENCDDGNNSCCADCCQRSSCKTYNCCHQTCRAECRSNACRTSCKKKCQPLVTVSHKETERKGESKTASEKNITTIIHLNNVINNTNLINLPISVNNRLMNNVTNRGAGDLGKSDKCCLTIGPRQCVPQTSFPFLRCFHSRKKACGSICSAPVVHYERHEICDNDVNAQQPCHQQTIYVPQPQPRCAYQSTWPYVTCGNQDLQSCEGCYSHYIKREDVTRCSNFCYDDGYGLGPYYRQGPFYRPGFAHVPSCYQTGTCGALDGYGYGYEGSLENGFPSAYPPQTYPFAIEECKNCTSPFPEDHLGSAVPRLNVKDEDSSNYTIQWQR